MTTEPEGVWIAYYPDGSSVVPFATEIEALRYAVEHKMEARKVLWGEPV